MILSPALLLSSATSSKYSTLANGSSLWKAINLKPPCGAAKYPKSHKELKLWTDPFLERIDPFVDRDPVLDSDIKSDAPVNRNTYGERSRVYRRTVFGGNEWVKHRSPERFFRNLSSTFTSGIFAGLVNEMVYVSIVAVFVVLWNNLMVDGFTDFQGVHHDSLGKLPHNYLLVLPQVPFTWSATALGLLLVFRTNTSYFRWNEARSAWGKTINHTRNVMRLASGWTLAKKSNLSSANKFEGSLADQVFLNYILKESSKSVWAFTRSMQRHVSSAEDDEEAFCKDVREYLDPEAAEALIKSRHRPIRALFDVTRNLDSLPVPLEEKVEIDKSIVVLADQIGACERLFTSPVPLVYTRHTERFLAAWLLFLPFALWEPFANTWNHVMMIPASMLLSFFFFGIEELAVQMEEPFSVLPMKRFTDGIKLAGEEYVSWHIAAKNITQDSYVDTGSSEVVPIKVSSGETNIYDQSPAKKSTALLRQLLQSGQN